ECGAAVEQCAVRVAAGARARAQVRLAERLLQAVRAETVALPQLGGDLVMVQPGDVARVQSLVGVRGGQPLTRIADTAGGSYARVVSFDQDQLDLHSGHPAQVAASRASEQGARPTAAAAIVPLDDSTAV